jgi:hypothetical protein
MNILHDSRYRIGLLLFLAVAAGLVWGRPARPVPQRAPDTLPTQYTDTEFWRLVTDFSETGGRFPYENFVSNEINYQVVIPDVKRMTRPGGVYLGVAPEQNFTYIAAIQPKIAFIFDIRRQNLVELLMYKALFEMSADRADFVSRLFSRPRPSGLTPASSARALFDAFSAVRPDMALYSETLQAIKDRLTKQHGFKLIGDDEEKIEYVFKVFFSGGPRMDYAYASVSPNSFVPSYHNLMIATDRRGQNWAYLAAEDNYRFVRTMQQKNMIIPVVGDFAGPKAIKSVAKYLKDHNAAVTVFYISNVEDYLSASWAGYRANLESLPVEPSGLFIRFVPQSTFLRPITDIPPRWPGRNW